ncbi:putative L-lysine 2,3-aminomutase [Paractinoplanes abujensis]|uniref:KamA family protein n=1 Tax=Paractinoplanes abujensis TaxID=882441 RepID=A0A7W7CK25_9ACTN|nr:KamA family protein [Actinoplanes abujensis]GID24636.1 putative L-lysine 2,3-aminomutase [Actinoplanes abujensis]
MGARQIDAIATRFPLTPEQVETVRLLSQVLPFRVNEYTLSELIDWDSVPDDPMFRMVFPQRGMLSPQDEHLLTAATVTGDRQAVTAAVKEIRGRLNPHPSGQQELNVPRIDGSPAPGLQHKYRETVLYFPSQGQSCHSYCTYCFRWAQFVGDADLRFATPRPDVLVRYLREHPEVHDVLITGGDPMIMGTDRLLEHLQPLLEVPTVRTVRIGTKSIAYWPQRFVTDTDADDLLRLFEQVTKAGRLLAVMAHFTHPRELNTTLAVQALARIRATGAVVYCQAPLIGRINDDARTWSSLWRAEIAAGAVPYYMFVERNTGPYEYFKVPLAKAADVFRAAYQTLPGLARTVRGPVMSATPGKVVVDGVEETAHGRFFQLRMLQARNPALVGRPFRARFSATAAWLDDLEPAADTPADIAAAVWGGSPGKP